MPVVGEVARVCDAILQCPADGRAIRDVLETMFELPGTDLEHYSPSAGTEVPAAVLQRISCPDTRQLAVDVNDMWAHLCRKVHIQQVPSVIVPFC